MPYPQYFSGRVGDRLVGLVGGVFELKMRLDKPLVEVEVEAELGNILVDTNYETYPN